MKSGNISYLPGLDHLRGYAALLIIFYHGSHLISHQLRYGEDFKLENWPQSNNPLLAILLEGHTAVALFMVLSGFIFSYGSYGKELSYSRFIINRLLRTYPLFVLLIAVGIFAFPQQFDFTALIQTLLTLGNTPPGLKLESFSAMFWAISVEWQFYLLFPFLLLFLNRDGAQALLGLIAVFIVMRALAWLQGANIRDLAYNTIIGRMDQFLLGMLAAVVYLKHRASIIDRRVLLLPLTILAALAALYFFHQAGSWPAVASYKIFWPTVEGIVWAGFIVAYLGFASALPARLSQLLVLPGLISYSLYLIHFVLISIVIEHGWFTDFGLPPLRAALLNTLLLLPMIMAISSLTYLFVEKPFLQLRLRYHRPPE